MEYGCGQLGCNPRGTHERLGRIHFREARVFIHHCHPSWIELSSRSLLTGLKPAEQEKSEEGVCERERQRQRHRETEIERQRETEKEIERQR